MKIALYLFLFPELLPWLHRLLKCFINSLFKASLLSIDAWNACSVFPDQPKWGQTWPSLKWMCLSLPPCLPPCQMIGTVQAGFQRTLSRLSSTLHFNHMTWFEVFPMGWTLTVSQALGSIFKMKTRTFIPTIVSRMLRSLGKLWLMEVIKV